MRAAYVATWPWNDSATSGVRENLDHVAELVTGPAVLNTREDDWSRDTHLQYLATQAAGARATDNPLDAPTNAAWTNLPNALALQVTERATMVTKKGDFNAFPATTQHMVLFATHRTEGEEAATAPVATYTEILELANAAYVAQHLHHHLKTRLGLDVWLPPGFCLAASIAWFISTSVNRPEAFSLFACGPQQPLVFFACGPQQPHTKKNSVGADDRNETAYDLMRVKVKVANLLTTGRATFR